ncbi:autophagy protein Apg5-domain-containing protein [Hyaloraphidium curvatum]|nr:autophagy protein Apg5-domain-containing protein [Hyaloraphidium curvatum]
MPDAAVTRRTWHAVLPVEIAVAADDGPAAPPFFALARRCGALSLLLPALRAHLAACGALPPADAERDAWFEFAGAPLRWHVPAGLLYDQLTAAAGAAPPLPWALRVRFSGFPADRLVRPHAPLVKDVAEDLFRNALKEAEFMRHGTVRRLMTLGKQEQDDIWRGVVSGDHDLYWSVSSKLVSEQDGQSRGIPLRVHFPDRSVVQDLVPKPAEGQPELTLGDALRQLVPDLFPPDGSPGPPPWALVHGLRVPLDAPLPWVAENLGYPDSFVHVCLVLDRADDTKA